MKPNQHTAEQIITILDQALTGKQTVASICRDYGIAEPTVSRYTFQLVTVAFGLRNVTNTDRGIAEMVRVAKVPQADC